MPFDVMVSGGSVKCPLLDFRCEVFQGEGVASLSESFQRLLPLDRVYDKLRGGKCVVEFGGIKPLKLMQSEQEILEHYLPLGSLWYLVHLQLQGEAGLLEVNGRETFIPVFGHTGKCCIVSLARRNEGWHFDCANTERLKWYANHIDDWHHIRIGLRRLG
jgi:hypothetical protein